MAKKKIKKNKKVKLSKNTILGAVAVAAIAVIIILIVVFYPSGNSMSPAAVVNGNVITMGELDKQYELVPNQYRSFIPKSSILEGMVNEELLMQEASKLGIETSDEEVDSAIMQAIQLYGMTEEDFLNFIDSQGVSVDEVKEAYRKKITMSKLLNMTVTSEVDVSVDEARAYYDGNKELFYTSEDQVAEFDTIKDQVIIILAQEKEKSLVNDYIETLKAEADIQLFLGEEDSQIDFEIQPVEEGQEEALLESQNELDSSVSAAECFSSKGAKLYGAGWSKNTQSQIEAFGSSFDDIDYVDCEKVKCKELGITNYPTWVINGQKYPGEKSLDELSALAGC
jgi:hypothetical protein